MRLAALLALLPGVALAQATVNPGALDQLVRPAPSTAPRTVPRPAPRPAPPSTARPAPVAALNSAPGRPAVAAKPSGPKPALPTTPPPAASLPPTTIVPTMAPPPLPVIAQAADAPGRAEPLPGGLRVTFGAERSDLNPDTVLALRQFATSLGKSEDVTVTLMAYAAGPPEDPSTPRRLSLARALTARAVLLDAGVASVRIYPRALGPAPDGPADRVDLLRFPAPAKS